MYVHKDIFQGTKYTHIHIQIYIYFYIKATKDFGNCSFFVYIQNQCKTF